MSKQLEFFFDILSPYSYLGSTQIPNLAAKHGFEVLYRPFDMRRARKAAGNDGPTAVHIPAKMVYVKQDLARWVARYGVPFVFPRNESSDKINSGTFPAIARGVAPAYVAAAYGAVWGEGGASHDDDLIAGVGEAMGWPREEFLAYLASDEAGAAYEANNQEAIDRGVFGAPTILIGDNMWWGNDRLEFLDEFLAA